MQASNVLSQNWLYSFLLLLASFASSLVMALAWRRRDRVPCARLMAIYSLTNVIWSFMYALHWSPMPRPGEFFWVDMTYIGAAFVNVTFLAFALCYAGWRDYLTKRNFILLSIIPTLTLFFLATDPWLEIFFAGKRVSGTSVIFDGGIGFWVFVIYSYALTVLSFLIILQTVFRFPKKYQGQVRMIFMGIFIPVLINALTFLGFTPFKELDLTPITFSLTGIFFSIAIFRFEFLDLMPVSRDVVFETHRDAILVLDTKYRIVDSNTFAMDLFAGSASQDLIGRSFSDLKEEFPALPSIEPNADDKRFEFSFPTYGDATFEMLVSLLSKRTGEVGGYIVTFHDISTQKDSESVILRANEMLKMRLEKIQALQNQLREEAIRDHLTGLYNRRYLHEVLRQYLEPARRRFRIISFALLDIDHFKEVNDTYGHDIGDEVLVGFSDFLLENTRSDDTVCRFGGEEFLIVFPDTLKAEVISRIEIWLKMLAVRQLSPTVADVKISFSCGIVSFPEDGDNMDALFKKADDHLYEAKNAGRNRVIAA
jgi:diguanylate cyclase (GGDEF)-like protein